MQHLKRMLIASVATLGMASLSLGISNVNASKIKYKAVAADKEQTLTLGLKSRNQKQLDRFINNTVNPKSKSYRKYLTPKQFGLKYGLSNQNVKVVKQYMAKHHLKTTVYPGNIVMTVTGQTKHIEKTFGIKIKQTTNQKTNHQVATGNARLRGGVNNYIQFIDQLGLKLHLTSDRVNASGNQVSDLSKIKDANVSDRSYRKFGRAYQTGSLYRKGHYGQGQTIGIMASGDFKLSDVQAYLKQSGVNADTSRIKKIYVSKTRSTDKGDREEVTMDTEQASAIAPKAKINVYIGNDYDADYFIPSFATAIGRDNVDVISSSFGAVEAAFKKGSPVNKGETKLMNLLLKQAAAQGISTFNATGDSGAYAFANGSLDKSVGLPAASPYITAVGGTTLPFKNLTFAEVANFTPTTDKTVSLNHEAPWSVTTSLNYLFGNDYVSTQYLNYLESKAQNEQDKQKIATAFKQSVDKKLTVNPATLNDIYGSGGGGFSTYFALPDYQKNVSGVGSYYARQYINFKTGRLNQAPQLIKGHASGRNVPDISGNADPFTGYNIYMDGKNHPFDGNGTSVITPQIAAMAAVINSAQGKRMGFWNPQIYRFAKLSNSPFTPLDKTTDNNLYYVGQPGKLYNQATGLGTVNFTKLNAAFKRAK
ncbi:S53 family peptidase (plasmid) [Nicoliella spurrieriana]|uniref:S53 family peptidase n=1 Tax=Nicoliella spurrieriana TaxID=2925830 RepID=A0A976RQM0_9LACO|nr:S53 family peptidase [Nicoliella spurrieriana]UQS85942.1 S53 family peptidase [Nicoliella spurrieriana]